MSLAVAEAMEARAAELSVAGRRLSVEEHTEVEVLTYWVGKLREAAADGIAARMERRASGVAGFPKPLLSAERAEVDLLVRWARRFRDAVPPDQPLPDSGWDDDPVG